ncbi:CRISPR system precrRNA processing endoribonuclease RAMP protein Cas6 [Metallosphaera tengchongensis]|uniref:CRISPR system precrRNA processing endoribonuclease RAMP protein Cas6 n=1 Tax=Metallosphaera tengchongensis TaxID=1532350 RepID=A0A6N0P044_9CREN|nr:CRISPR system precrRNA processing endoribonuclease RAMP protein Cas6 [Metallosphaera tengchongensis]QKR00721.1 CRISPR system precrRNA processing endoribonuclease RAMP protein Cas6 [Metallosphaera tengchongensis]
MTFLISATYSVVPERDVILPPLTSKVLKYVLEGHPKIGSLVKSAKKYKEISIFPLFLRGRYLYSTGPGVMTLRAKERASFTFSLASEEVDPEVFEKIPNEVSTPYGDFVMILEEIRMTELGEVRAELGHKVNVRFETPTLLSNKYMVPPNVKARKLRQMNRLLPQPSLLISSLARIWNSIATPKEVIVLGDSDWTPYKLGRIADVMFAEVGYSLTPVTVVVGKDKNGNLRKTRGFNGWVKYEVVEAKRYTESMEKLLGLANFLGVGRSRGIGFGKVKVERV